MLDKKEYVELLQRFFPTHCSQKTEDPMFDYDNVNGRYLFGILLSSLMRQPQIAIRMMLSIVRDVEQRILSCAANDVKCLVQALIFLGSSKWRMDRDEQLAQTYFEKALHYIDCYPGLDELVGKVFYERCLVMSDCEYGHVALNIAFEMIDGYERYGQQTKNKKMFYVYMAVAAIAHEESQLDFAVEYLWKAFAHLENCSKPLQMFMRRQYQKKAKNPGNVYIRMIEHLEMYL